MDVSDRLVDPGGPEFLVGEVPGGQRTPLFQGESQDPVGEGGVQDTETGELLGLDGIEVQKRKLERLCDVFNVRFFRGPLGFHKCILPQNRDKRHSLYHRPEGQSFTALFGKICQTL